MEQNRKRSGTELNTKGEQGRTKRGTELNTKEEQREKGNKFEQIRGTKENRKGEQNRKWREFLSDYFYNLINLVSSMKFVNFCKIIKVYLCNCYMQLPILLIIMQIFISTWHVIVRRQTHVWRFILSSNFSSNNIFRYYYYCYYQLWTSR